MSTSFLDFSPTSALLNSAIALLKRIRLDPATYREVSYGSACWAVGEVLRSRVPFQWTNTDLLLRLAERLSVPLREEDLNRFVMLNAFYSWRHARLTCCPDQEFSEWVSVDGLDIIESLRREGRGILLAVSHLGPIGVVNLALTRAGHTVHALMQQDIMKATFGLGPEDHGGRYHVIEVMADTSPNLIKTANTVRGLLKNGSIVCVASDGPYGNKGVPANFLGIMIEPRIAAVLAATMSGAAVVPVSSGVDGRGRISVTIHEPLPAWTPPLDMQDYVNHAVLENVRILENKWLKDPGNIHKGTLNAIVAHLGPSVPPIELRGPCQPWRPSAPANFTFPSGGASVGTAGTATIIPILAYSPAAGRPAAATPF